jgi:hypothetical protein
LKKVTFVRPSKDPKRNIEQKKEALRRAQEFATKYQQQMFKQREFMKMYAEKQRKQWEMRMRQLKIDHTNMMVKPKPGEEVEIIVE